MPHISTNLTELYANLDPFFKNNFNVDISRVKKWEMSTSFRDTYFSVDDALPYFAQLLVNNPTIKVEDCVVDFDVPDIFHQAAYFRGDSDWCGEKCQIRFIKNSEIIVPTKMYSKIIFFINLIPSGITHENAHAALFIFDLKKKFLTFYDPHGETTYGQQVIDLFLTSLRKFDTYKIDKTGFCTLSLQHERASPIFNFVTHTTQYKNTIDPGGYCQAWCILLVHNILRYPNNSLTDIISNLRQLSFSHDSYSFTLFIRGYTAALMGCLYLTLKDFLKRKAKAVNLKSLTFLDLDIAARKNANKCFSRYMEDFYVNYSNALPAIK